MRRRSHTCHANPGRTPEQQQKTSISFRSTHSSTLSIRCKLNVMWLRLHYQPVSVLFFSLSICCCFMRRSKLISHHHWRVKKKRMQLAVYSSYFWNNLYKIDAAGFGNLHMEHDISIWRHMHTAYLFSFFPDIFIYIFFYCWLILLYASFFKIREREDEKNLYTKQFFFLHDFANESNKRRMKTG